ncbi:MAG: hypothetical protein ACRDKL_00105 [Solirubrobacteraceae bacterium]
MPLISGTVYLFGQILSFALPVSLLLAFAAFFYRQGKRAREAAPKATTALSGATAGSAGAGVTSAATTPAPEAPPTPSHPYSDL